jgi:hypothetical protein
VAIDTASTPAANPHTTNALARLMDRLHHELVFGNDDFMSFPLHAHPAYRGE